MNNFCGIYKKICFLKQSDGALNVHQINPDGSDLKKISRPTWKKRYETDTKIEQ